MIDSSEDGIPGVFSWHLLVAFCSFFCDQLALSLPQDFRRNGVKQAAHGGSVAFLPGSFKLTADAGRQGADLRLKRCVFSLKGLQPLLKLFQKGGTVLHVGQRLFKQSGQLGSVLFGMKRVGIVQKGEHPFCHAIQMDGFLESLRCDMRASRPLRALSAIQLRISLCHVSIEFILPERHLFSVPDDLLRTESAVLRQRYEDDVHVRRLFVQMHHGGDEGIPLLMPGEEADRVPEVILDLFAALALEELR